MLSVAGQIKIYREIFYRNALTTHDLDTPDFGRLLDETPTERMVKHALDYLAATGAQQQSQKILEAWKTVCELRYSYLDDRKDDKHDSDPIEYRIDCAEDFVPLMRDAEL